MTSSNSYFSRCFQTQKTQSQQDEELKAHQHYKQITSTLPLETSWKGMHFRNFRNFWLPEVILPGVLSLQHNFKPVPSDLILVTYPKSGTTWLKALAFAILCRTDHDPSSPNHPLLTRHPQDCSPWLEGMFATARIPNLAILPSPRLLATHVPYSVLPDLVKDSSDCKIVYLSREPKDTLVSTWHFAEGMRPETAEPKPFSEAFEQFCGGSAAYGSVWEHQLEFWKESVRRPEKVLFLKYEEMKEEAEKSVRRLAEFMGQSFSEEEEREGMVGEIVRLCSFENLSGLDVNRKGVRAKETTGREVKNSSFFRKGKVGDWKEHLSPEMAVRMDRITREELEPFGLTYQ